MDLHIERGGKGKTRHTMTANELALLGIYTKATPGDGYDPIIIDLPMPSASHALGE